MAVGDYKAGTAWLEIVPSFRGIEGAMRAEVEKIGRAVDATIAKSIPEGVRNGTKNIAQEMERAGEEGAKGFTDGVDKGLKKHGKDTSKGLTDGVKGDMEEAGEESAMRFAGAFKKALRARTGPAQSALPKIEADVDTSKLDKLDKRLNRIRANIAALDKAFIKGTMPESDLFNGLTKQREALLKVMQQARSYEQFHNARSSMTELDNFDSMVRNGRREGYGGGSFGGTFNRTLESRLQETLNALPQGSAGSKTTDSQAQLLALRTKVQTLSQQRVGIDIDESEAIFKIQHIKRRLDELAKHPTEVRVRTDAAAASAGLEKILKEFGAKADTAGAEVGDRFGGRFAEKFSQHAGRAVAALPNIQGDLTGATDSQLSLKTLRDQLDEMSKKTIGVNIDEGMAIAQLEDIKRRLDELARTDPSVRVRVEAAAASAELTEILVLAGRVDKSNPTVKAKVEGKESIQETSSYLDRLADAAGIGGSRLAMLVSVGIALGSVVAPAAAAAAVAIGGIGQAAAAAGAGVGVFALGLSGIGGAVQALDKYENDAQKTASSLGRSQEQVAGALDSVRSAEMSLANARENVADAAKRAAQTVVDAQKGVIDAEKQAAQAVKDLQQAYEDAQRAEEDRALALRSTSLAQRRANLELADAKKKLDALVANSRATDAEKEAARVAYEERVLQLDELTVKQKRLQEEQTRADNVGIEGSKQVVNARDRVQAANDNVAKSQQRLADSIDAQQRQQRQGTFQLAQATQAVTNAQRQLEKASLSASVAGGAALDNLNWSMQQLGPSGERFAKFLFSLKGEFLSLRAAAQGSMLPGLQKFIEGVVVYLPQIKTFVGQVGSALGGIFIDMVEQLKDPTWQSFFGFIADTAVPTLQGMYKFTSYIAKGVADLIMALSPLNRSMGSGLLNMAEGFAKWANSLTQSGGYYKFLDYVVRVGPRVVQLLEQLGTMVIRIVVAAAPIGEFVLKAVNALAGAFNSIPLSVLTTLLGGLALLYSTLLSVTIAAKAFGFIGKIFEGVNKAQEAVVGGAKRVAGEYNTALKGTADAAQEAGKGHDFMSSRLVALTPTFNAAAQGANQMSRGMAAATVAGKGLRAGFSSLMGLMGGPLGLVLTGATALITYMGYKAVESKSRVDGIASSLLGLAEASDKGSNAANQYLVQQIRSDDNFRRMIKNSDTMGLGLNTITQAVHGNKHALDQLNGVYDTQISNLTAANDLLSGSAEVWNELPAEYEQARKLEDEVRKKYGVSVSERLDQLKEERKAFGRAAGGYRELQVALGVVGDESKNFSTRVNELKAAMTGGNVSAEEYKTAISNIGAISNDTTVKMHALGALSDSIAASQLTAAEKAGLFKDVLTQLGSSAGTSGATFDALAGTFDNIANSALSASDKTALMKQSLDQMYGAARSQSEADDRLIQSQAELQLRLQDSALGFDVHRVSTAADEQAVIANRNALREVLKATEDKYIADIASAQGSDNQAAAVQRARQAHDDQVQAILNEIPASQRTSEAVQGLIKTYGQIPPERHTDIKVNGDQALKDLIKAFAFQKGLAEQWNLNAINQYYYALYDEFFGPKINTAPVRRADGGLIPGWSPHKRADNILARLTAGEYVQPVDTVDYYGASTMDAIRNRVIPRELLSPELFGLIRQSVRPQTLTPGDGSGGIAFANGGLVSGPLAGGPIWPFPITTTIGMPVSLPELERRAREGIYYSGPIPSNVAGVQDWIRQQAGKPYIWASAGPVGFDCSGIVSAAFNLMHGQNPNNHTFSTHNQGSYFPMSGSGLFTSAWTNPGESGVGGGPNGVGHTAANLAGLLFESRGGDGVVVGNQVTKLNRFAHIGHYDNGGKLPVGIGAYLNTTGTPENVLTDQQWNSVFELAGRQQQSQGHNYNFAFQDTTLTPSKLRAMQAEDAVRAREGRSR